MNNKEHISIAWLKRDLRLQDNEAIASALKTNTKVLLLYVFEDVLLTDAHYSKRHFTFIKQSLHDINIKLQNVNSKVLVVQDKVESVFEKLREKFNIENVFSHQETGIKVTFDRDKAFKKYCLKHQINWIENINNGVFRGLKNRQHWVKRWESYMFQPLVAFQPKEEQLLHISEVENLEELFKCSSLSTKKSKLIQYGGTSTGLKYLDSFFKERYVNYMFHISKPQFSRSSCSRLSPYIAWGNLSIREVFQQAKQIKKESKYKRHLGAFMSRLRWQAHFIQKFEMESSMEFVSVNKGYHKLNKPFSQEYFLAWSNGKTGFPLVDASMRCLNETGYVNFRMRAMLVSFFTHILWQPWQYATYHLAKQFLDFEPGIHFPQLQMQAGETGINNLRIYNPIKNAQEHDSEAIFIKKWVPELAHLPIPFIHEPYLMTALDQQFNNCALGEDYPNPIINIKENRKKASDILWNMKRNNLVRKESMRILAKHTLSDRKILLKTD